MKNNKIGVVATLLAMVLTAKIGTVQYNGHKETWYNLNMRRVVERSDQALGVTDQYWVRDDGCKMYGPWIIVAAHPSVARYSLVETSLGTGIVLDTHTVSSDKLLFDLAVDW